VAASKRAVEATAFTAGVLVMVIEIGGSRALAPFFGSSLRVWTSTITSTLGFLAVGYALGGRLSRRPSSWHLPLLFCGGGLWLCLYPLLRTAVLDACAVRLGVAGGSLASATLLFGAPLAALGASTPLLVGSATRADARDAGAASGRLFFINTLGSLAGGWMTALLLIPFASMRLSLLGTGLALALLGTGWAWHARRLSLALAAPLACLLLALAAPSPASDVRLANGYEFHSLERQQTQVGLLQVFDIQPLGVRVELLDGVTQGGMRVSSGLSYLPFTEALNVMAWRYHPQARSALLLGLGPGLLAKELAARGLSVTAAELEPRVRQAAQAWFGLPDSVRVAEGDGRAFLRRDQGRYDLIVLDAYAGECAPWYLATREALAQVKQRLAPGGRLLVNTVTTAQADSPGLLRLEAEIGRVFPEALVMLAQEPGEPLVNAALVAGSGLEEKAKGDPPMALEASLRDPLKAMEASARPVTAGPWESSDDFSDLDSAEAGLRARFRQQVMQELGPSLMAD
jgi:spermidine synthase